MKDRDGNGILDSLELMDFLESMGVVNVEYTHAKILLDTYDTNSSDSLDKDEFVTMMRNGFGA